ncbi:TniQ family protein [Wohlfahrtiimonas chitiniclastica]|uniref:TniQ family protein n=1 Tax=Wohlfahrtiimonas chitiniclastica TaxID=400946 RepID=UPI00164BC8B9|nr:TniQ family protein [Wohlfahrtiimonas chitiniclastica]
MFTDECLLSYLQRLADINNYDRLLWIIQRSLPHQISYSYDDIKTLVQNTSWTLYHQQDSLTQEINKLSAVLKGKIRELRICPQCLQEHRYYRAKWFLNTSTVCLKHKQELISQCPSCYTVLPNKPHSIGICPICKYDLATVHTLEQCSQLLLQLQYFIENHDLLVYEDADHRFLHLTMFQSRLDTRLQFLHFFLRWLPSNVEKKIEQLKKSSINQIDVAHEQLQMLTSIIFINRESFVQYLTTLQTLSLSQETKAKNYFIKFYRTLYKHYPSNSEMLHYKRIVEHFYRNYCVDLITHKHSLFSEELRTHQLWMTLKQACKQYKIERGVLRFGISQGLVVAIQQQKGQRLFTYCLRSSIEDSLEQLSSQVTFKEACKILGVTKKQLYRLINSGIFENMISAHQSKSHYWNFDAQYLYLLLNQLFHKASSFTEEKISIADALRKIGNRIEEALPKILWAILNDQLRIDTIGLKPENIRSITLCYSDLEILMFQYIKKPETLSTIPEIAKKLKLNQEFTYQLINYQFLQYIQIDNTRFISQEHLSIFHEQYIILSHYCAQNSLTSGSLIKQLERYHIYPVDHHWNKNQLRQKVYKKTEIIFFENKMEEFL